MSFKVTEKNITRCVIDFSWNGVYGLYGADNGSYDCGTIYLIENLLKHGLENDLLLEKETGLTATKADWISYSTNVKHVVDFIVPDGKALHPLLRKSKGLYTSKQS